MNTVLARVSKVINRERKAQNLRSGLLVLVGRLCFSFMFIAAGLNHFTAESITMAGAHGVPLASIVVPASGVLSLAGGLSVLIGYRAKLGAWLLALFLVPVTVTMHRFWGIADPAMAQWQLIMFLKNVSLLGGALIVTQFGVGPLSLDARRMRQPAPFQVEATIIIER